MSIAGLIVGFAPVRVESPAPSDARRMRSPTPAPVTHQQPSRGDRTVSQLDRTVTEPAKGATLSVWASPEPYDAFTSTAERRSRSDALVEEIAVALAAAGEHAARIDMLPIQRLVDFKWAAHQAGRRLGMRIRIEVQLAKVDADGLVPVGVTPKQPPD